MPELQEVLVLLYRPVFGSFFPAIDSAEVVWAVAVVQTAKHGDRQCVAGSAVEGPGDNQLLCLLTT